MIFEPLNIIAMISVIAVTGAALKVLGECMKNPQETIQQ